MLRRTDNGLITYHFEKLAGQAVIQAVFTRLGGVSQGPYSTLNVGRSVGDDLDAVAENLARIYRSLGLAADQVVTAYQVHSNRVAVVSTTDRGQLLPNTDGLVTDSPELVLLLRFADCQSILLYDPVRHALGLAHAGWRGVAQGMARRAVEAMQAAFGTQPADLLVGLGPAIGPCCYTVGDDVAAAMGYALPDWQAAMQADPSGQGWRLDLSAANSQQLVAAGVAIEHVEQAGLCTACHRAEFFSHRGDNGLTGRFALVACLLPRPGISAGPDQAGTGGKVSPGEPSARPDIGTARRRGPDSGPPDTLQPPGLPDLGEALS